VSLPNLNPIPEPTLIYVPIELKIEPPILDSRISLMGKECEIQFFYLDSTLESKPTLEPKLDLSHIPESMLVLVPFIPEPKSSIPQNRVPLLDLGIEYNDSVMYSKIGHIIGINLTLGSCIIIFMLGIVYM